ncbi:heparinase II/III family protein [Maribellus sp. YY47]|uniref:heparinase II/III domain-containing protein n=1 Tax=Maribellus sp. YY47 TaxID=2929486 RepID=UPI00200189F9|nr:heparinase II/III family protein [Maribellus sp. YY47]MCK3685348.1 heparinase II/III-family protein [Maribellus sp. YY47]
MNRNKIVLLIFLLFPLLQLTAQQGNPHILVKPENRQAVLEKIERQAWAKTIFDKMRNNVESYADRHQTDKEWILSRYLMNRVPGKRYTTVYSDNSGKELIKWEGDAPVPTVRVNTYLRTPITEKGTSYRKPTIEELVPNDTCRLMYLFNPETEKKEWVDPQAYITSINGDINKLAQDAAIIYWLTGEEKFATFAADILDQWVKGAYYQEPIVGPCRTGFLDMQTLGDAVSRPLILAYDFIKPFMRQKDYDLSYYDTVFEKIASTLAFRGYWNNNWYAAESSTMVFAALSLDNQQKRDYYLQFFLEKDTINGSCGQLALPSTVEKWLTHDGHWKEPGGYHNYPVGNLLISALSLENNGFDVFLQFPALFRASYAMLKYSFPNLTVSAFGDTGRASQSAESLEIGLIGAVKYKQPELPEMLASMKKLIDGDKYRRDESGFLGLLCFLPEIPETTSSFEWPRTGTLDFARYFLQRNGTDPKKGLMVGVQGATYNHNHCNGMAMELYGLGEVMGIDAGTGPNYEHPIHRNYYSQWAAHNTVVAAGASSSVPFSGSAGTKQIGQIEMEAMEPMPDSDAVSPDYSFTDTRYFDKSTNTNQLRTLAVVRTSSSSGYYVDIFRSDNEVSNDYVYHNMGEGLVLTDKNSDVLKTVSTTYPLTEKDYPGFRFFTDVRKLEDYAGNITALFTVKENEHPDKYMQVLVPGAKDLTYFTALSPKVKTSGHQYKNLPQPVFTIRARGQAWNEPFIAVFEPFEGNGTQTVREVEKIEELCSNENTVLKVYNRNDSEQIILQGNDCDSKIDGNNILFQGYFGVISLKNDQPEHLYLGKGKEIGYGPMALTAESDDLSAEIRRIENASYLVSCTRPVKLILENSTIEEVILVINGLSQKIEAEPVGKGVSVLIPSVMGAEVKW